jgi:hypothetical protein
MFNAYLSIKYVHNKSVCSFAVDEKLHRFSNVMHFF